MDEQDRKKIAKGINDLCKQTDPDTHDLQLAVNQLVLVLENEDTKGLRKWHERSCGLLEHISKHKKNVPPFGLISIMVRQLNEQPPNDLSSLKTVARLIKIKEVGFKGLCQAKLDIQKIQKNSDEILNTVLVAAGLSSMQIRIMTDLRNNFSNVYMGHLRDKEVAKSTQRSLESRESELERLLDDKEALEKREKQRLREFDIAQQENSEYQELQNQEIKSLKKHSLKVSNTLEKQVQIEIKSKLRKMSDDFQVDFKDIMRLDTHEMSDDEKKLHRRLCRIKERLVSHGLKFPF